jgi:hypothetical protein
MDAFRTEELFWNESGMDGGKRICSKYLYVLTGWVVRTAPLGAGKYTQAFHCGACEPLARGPQHLRIDDSSGRPYDDENVEARLSEVDEVWLGGYRLAKLSRSVRRG